jgi:hypothetical protein
MGAKALEYFQRDIPAARFENGVERFQPLLNFHIVQALQMRDGFLVHVLGFASKIA